MMNFDDLKNQWQAADADLDQRVQLNKAALRQQLLQQSQRGVRRLRWFKRTELLSNAVMLALLLLFCWRYAGDGYLLASGIAVLFVQLWYAKVAWNQHRDLQAVDYTQPIDRVQQQLERLRERRLQTVKQLVVLGFAVWPLFTIVLIKGLFGVNLFHLLGEIAMQYYIGGGVVLALLLWLVWTAIAAITPQVRWLQTLRRDAAGATLNAALNQLHAVAELDNSTEDAPDAATQQYVRQLRIAPMLAIAIKSAVILLLGLGNALHGGQAEWLIPGVVLTVFVGTQIGFSAMQLALLRSAIDANRYTLLWSAFDAYTKAVESNARWWWWTSPITLLCVALLIAHLFAVVLLPTSIGILLAIALLCAMLLTKTTIDQRLTTTTTNWLNTLSRGAFAKLQTKRANVVVE